MKITDVHPSIDSYVPTEEKINHLSYCPMLEAEIRNITARTSSPKDLKSKLLSAVDVLRKKEQGLSTNEIASTIWGYSWVDGVTLDYIEKELEYLKSLKQQELQIKPITVVFMDFYRHKTKQTFDEDEIISVLEGIDKDLNDKQLAMQIGSNPKAISKLVEILENKDITLSDLNETEIGGDTKNVRNKRISNHKGSSRRIRSDKGAVKKCTRPMRY
jgi:RNAse (barnase) inhibitor barstar